MNPQVQLLSANGPKTQTKRHALSQTHDCVTFTVPPISALSCESFSVKYKTLTCKLQSGEYCWKENSVARQFVFYKS